ncbi:MAG: hypothetical protein Q8R40_05055 [bacterium]|nr:hypothetical protein [bacterium]
MQIISCGSVPVCMVRMIVEKMLPYDRKITIYGKEKEDHFCIGLPKRVAKNINLNDTLVILCIPSEDLSVANDVLVVAKTQHNITRVIFSQSRYWTDTWTHMAY